MNIDRWAVVYLLVSAFYPVLKPSVFPDPWANAAAARGPGPGRLVRAAHAAGQPDFVPRLLGEIYLPLFFPLFYAEMEYLGLIFFDFEDSLDPALIGLEEWIFGFQPSLEWSRVWPWPWFHELMEFAYFTYYFLAAAFLVLVFTRQRPGATSAAGTLVRDFIRDLSATMLICYTLYTLFPAWGPKYFRAGYVEVDGWIFTDIMLHIHDNGALLGAAFPSSHVAASMMPWWHTWADSPATAGG